MDDIRNKYVAPASNQTAFNCPHCGAFAMQFWHSCHTEQLKSDQTAVLVTPEELEEFKVTLKPVENRQQREKLEAWAMRMATGRPFMDSNRAVRNYDMNNMHVTRCYNCREVAIWIYDRLVWPVQGTAPLPNPDLPDDVRADYEEASTILDPSPRGAAALLRLCIQKLCKHLGETGKNINDDIAELLKKGLDPRVQQALDVVRVVGNNAVHPGQIYLKDNRATAEKLFGLVNLIAEIMITQPKHVASMYNSLPANAREAIEKRDGNK